MYHANLFCVSWMFSFHLTQRIPERDVRVEHRQNRIVVMGVPRHLADSANLFFMPVFFSQAQPRKGSCDAKPPGVTGQVDGPKTEER